jgi:hypothetical protein
MTQINFTNNISLILCVPTEVYHVNKIFIKQLVANISCLFRVIYKSAAFLLWMFMILVVIQ